LDLLLLAGLLEPMSKRIIEPNTTLYPRPAVLITVGGPSSNMMELQLQCFLF